MLQFLLTEKVNFLNKVVQNELKVDQGEISKATFFSGQELQQ